MGWCLSPEAYLRRPAANNLHYRLDCMLKAAAIRGVKIEIILSNESEDGLSDPGLHTKLALEGLHENIKVVLHAYQKSSVGNILSFSDTPDIYWCNHEKLCIVDGRTAFLGGVDICFGRWDTYPYSISDSNVSNPEYLLFTDEDFINARAFDFFRPDHPRDPKVDRLKDCRMAWHDPAVSVEGPVIQDLVAHFVQRWNFENNLKPDPGSRLGYYQLLSNEQAHSFGEKSSSGINMQVLRSVSLWNNGTPTEHSILGAYLDTIKNSQHFLYFEQQYFITATSEDQHPILNRIGEAIVERILRAAISEQKFKVIVVMPAVPTFAGDVQYDSSPGTLAIMGLQYSSICRGGHSIRERISEAGFDASDYISFNNLRTYDCINNRATTNCAQTEPEDGLIPGNRGTENDIDNFVSEEVYVHSKLLIADDRVVVIGSANLGDRSMVGYRDSELGIVIEDSVMIDSYMNGVPFQVSRFAASMRKNLFLKHLGLAPVQTSAASYIDLLPGDKRHNVESDLKLLVEDPLSTEFERWWSETARINTEVFQKVFRPLPSNAVRNWEDYHVYHGQFFDRRDDSKQDPKYRYGHVFKENFGGGVQEVKQELEKIRGTLVEMPLNFMCEVEDLARKGFHGKLFQAEIYS